MENPQPIKATSGGAKHRAQHGQPQNGSLYPGMKEAALQYCEEKFRVLLAACAEGVAIHDRLKVIEANPALAKMFGYHRSEVIGRDVLAFIAPQERDKIMDRILSDDTHSMCTLGLCKDATTIPVEFSSRCIVHSGSRRHLSLLRQLDAADVKATDTDSNEHLDALFNNSPDAYYLADATGDFIDVNTAARKLFGLKKEDIIGKSFLTLKIFPPEQIHRAARHLVLNIFNKPAASQQYVLQPQDGRQIPVEISTIPVEINGKTLLFGLVRDISEKKKAERAFQRATLEIEALIEKLKTCEKNHSTPPA